MVTAAIMESPRVSYRVLITILVLAVRSLKQDQSQRYGSKRRSQIAWDGISTYHGILHSPPSPTIVRASEWDLCGQLDIWALGWRTLLHASAALLVRAILLE